MEITNKKGETPLHFACAGGSKELVAALLERGAKIDTRDEAGFTPLLNAVERGDIELFELLVAKGADPKVVLKDGRSALHLLCAPPAKSEAVERLLALGLSVEARDQWGNTPLMMAANFGRRAAAEILIRHGAEPNVVTEHGDSPLMSAAEAGRSQRPRPWPFGTPQDYRAICDLLLAKGARVDVVNRSGLTILHAAAGSDHLKLIELCLAKGVDVNKATERGVTPLHAAAAFGRAATIEALLRAGAQGKAVDRTGKTPLHFAVSSKPNPEVFALLKKNGGNLEAPDEQDQGTPLTRAATYGNVVAVRALLKLGANPNAPDSRGFFPLHLGATVLDLGRVFELAGQLNLPMKEIALQNAPPDPATAAKLQRAYGQAHTEALKTELAARHLEIVRLLLDAGASPTARTPANQGRPGETALDRALQLGSPEIVELLQQALRSRGKLPR